MTDPESEDLRPLSPSAARRRLGNELRALREATGLKLDDAAHHLQRSSATVSRLEAARVKVPRLVDIAALLELYASRSAQAVPPEVRERVLQLAADSRKKQWFEPFRDVITGDMASEHMAQLVEYETDASEIRNFEPDIVPGLLQNRDYALAVTTAFYPGRDPADHHRFADFRIARQAQLQRRASPLRLSAIIGESALRRPFGGPGILRDQLLALAAAIEDERSNVDVRILTSSVTLPAALGGPFMLIGFDSDNENDLVYLESRSGSDYLMAPNTVERFNLYFDSLLESALGGADAVGFITGLADSLG